MMNIVSLPPPLPYRLEIWLANLKTSLCFATSDSMPW